MATVTHYLSNSTSGNTAAYTTASFTPTVNDLILVFTVASGEGNTGTLSDSGGGSYTVVTTARYNSSTATITAFVANALVTTSAGITVTTTYGADAATGQIAFIAGISGMTLTGASAIKQSTVLQNQAASTPTPVFAANVSSSNTTIGVVGNATNPATLTPPASWTEQTDTGYTTPATGGEYVSRDNGFNGTTVTWASTSASVYGVIMLELDTSTGSPPGAGWAAGRSLALLGV